MTVALFIGGIVWLLAGLALGVSYITGSEEFHEMNAFELTGFLIICAVLGFPALVAALATIVAALVYGIFKFSQLTKKGDR